MTLSGLATILPTREKMSDYRDLGYNEFFQRPFSSPTPRMSVKDAKTIIPIGGIDPGRVGDYLRFTTDIVFSATDNDTAAWTSGTINFVDGTVTETISAGDTGDITSTTFVYYDAGKKGSLQTSTSSKDAIGKKKTLLAIVEKVSDTSKKCKITPISATGLVVSEITADQIAANTITATELAASYIEVGNAADDVNSYTTKISPGQILISGSTTLSDWRSGADATKIDGGNIYTNTITATQIAVEAITATEIKANSIITSKINDHAVTFAKTSAGSFSNCCMNPGFETGDKTDWTFSGGYFFVGTSANRSGKYGLDTGNLPGTQGDIIADSAPVNCMEGDQFYASFWVKAGGGNSGTFSCYIQWLDADGNEVAADAFANFSAPPSGWVKKSKTATCPSGACKVRIHLVGFDAQNPAGVWYFDDFFLTKKIEYAWIASINADTITTGTLTGRTVQTATSGARVVVDGTANNIKIYNASDAVVAELSGSSLEFYGDKAKIYFNAGKTAYIEDSGSAGGYVTFYGGAKLEIGGNGKYIRWGQTGYEDGIRIDTKLYVYGGNLDVQGHSITNIDALSGSGAGDISLSSSIDVNGYNLKNIGDIRFDTSAISYIKYPGNSASIWFYDTDNDDLDMEVSKSAIKIHEAVEIDRGGFGSGAVLKVSTPSGITPSSSGSVQCIRIDADSSNGWAHALQVYRNSTKHAHITAEGNMWLAGNLSIDGSLSKGSGSFDIPHPDPSKPKGTRLRHCFVESPTAGDNIYRYQVKVENGRTEIALPSYFKYLNENPQAWVSPVNVLGMARAECDLEKVKIFASKDGIYNVLVIGTRKDPIAVEHWRQRGLEYVGQDDKL